MKLERRSFWKLICKIYFIYLFLEVILKEQEENCTQGKEVQIVSSLNKKATKVDLKVEGKDDDASRTNWRHCNVGIWISL